jgi:hypothetical protein
VRVTRSWAEYLDRTVEVSHVGTGWVAVVDDGGDFPPDADRGESGGVAWVRLPSSVVPRRWRERVHGRWQGEDVQLHPSRREGEVAISWIGPTARGRELGMQGDQQMGWTKVVPEDQVEPAGVEIEELI